jgi:hypothetical protein
MSGLQKFQPAPIEQQTLLDKGGTLSSAWSKWFRLVSPRLTQPVVSATPTATGPGLPGQIAFDSNFLYICVATNVWKKIGLSSLAAISSISGIDGIDGNGAGFP